jgi:hypothetical protein
MAARPCAARLGSGELCEESKNSPIHLRASGIPGAHPYMDARGAARLAPQSQGRTEYLRSAAHQRAYGDAQAADGRGEGVCIAHLGGAPGECSRDRVPHHIRSRGSAGGLEAAERDGVVVMVCSLFNGDVESDPRTRRWAERNTFERDGREFPFRMSVTTKERTV